MRRVRVSAHNRFFARYAPAARREGGAGFAMLKARPDRRCEMGASDSDALALQDNPPLTMVEHPKTPTCDGGVWKTSERWFLYNRLFR